MTTYTNDNIVDQLREQVRISEVIGRRIAVSGRGRQLKALCPFHPDTQPSLQISDEKGIFKCFACGMGGDVIKFVMEYDKIPFIDTLRKLAAEYGLTLPRQFNRSQTRPKEDPHQEIKAFNAHAAQIYHKFLLKHQAGKAARDYLRLRGIKDKAITTFQLGYAPQWFNLLTRMVKQPTYAKQFTLKTLQASNLFHWEAPKTGSAEQGGTDKKAVHLPKDKNFSKEGQPLRKDFFNNRIIFPIRNEKGVVLGFGGRALDNHPAKYLNSRESPWFLKHEILYGMWEGYQLLMKHREVFVVEGYLDVLALQALSLPAVAPMGTAITVEQLRYLKRYVKRVNFLFDGDEAGRKASFLASSLAAALEMDGNVYQLPAKSDPFAFVMTQQGNIETIGAYLGQHCLNIYDYLLKSALKFRTPQQLSPIEKKEALEQVMPVYVALKDSVVKGAFRARLRAIFQADPEVLRQQKVFPSLLRSYRSLLGGDKAFASVDAAQATQRTLHQTRAGASVVTRHQEETITASRRELEQEFVLFLAKYPRFLGHAASLLYGEDFADAQAQLIYQRILHLKNVANPQLTHVLDLFKDQTHAPYYEQLLKALTAEDEVELASPVITSTYPAREKTSQAALRLPQQEPLATTFEELYCRFKLLQLRDQTIALHRKAKSLAETEDLTAEQTTALRVQQETLLRLSAEKRTLQDYLSRDQTFSHSTTAYQAL